MAERLIQLPGNNWVAPERVSSVSTGETELGMPCVVVRTKDGATFVIDDMDKPAHEVRDEIAEMVNKEQESA